ncbi:MAG: ACT domain-containing protein [Actinomycetota bacterium]|nr:ACT domain-containing protein [Actinomycetota bacterium]
MPTEIVVEAEDRPGVLAGIGELFGEVHVNITAAAAFTHGGKGIMHFVVDDAERAIKALEGLGMLVTQVREVLTVSVEDRPGELGRYTRKLADAGINIAAFYTGGTDGGDRELILAVDNLESALGRLSTDEKEHR